LTEVPIIRALIDLGMGRGPALALLLAGPSLSLPSMIVLIGIMGWKKAGAYIILVVIMATLTGMIFGSLIS
ncbi:MAG: permease, partial [Candidatus Zixiibacteriota bacterium]